MDKATFDKLFAIVDKLDDVGLQLLNYCIDNKVFTGKLAKLAPVADKLKGILDFLQVLEAGL